MYMYLNRKNRKKIENTKDLQKELELAAAETEFAGKYPYIMYKV